MAHVPAVSGGSNKYIATAVGQGRVDCGCHTMDLSFLVAPVIEGASRSVSTDPSLGSAARQLFVDLAVVNGMGIPLAELSLDRWRAADGALPAYLRTLSELQRTVGTLLRQTREQFVDPHQTTLDAPDTLLPPRISKRVQSEEVHAIEERRLKEYQEATQKRREELRRILTAAPLRPVHSWRRSYHVIANPVLFGEGNKVLAEWPASVKLPTDLVSYAPTFLRSVYDDSFFLLALAHVASRRSCLRHLFASCEFHDAGLYAFQFYQVEDVFHYESGWRSVTVDDLLPCDGEQQRLFGKTKDRSEIWATMAEKAYAKFLGSYMYLHHGDHARAMVHLTGGVAYTWCWDPSHIDSDNQSVLWWRIKENCTHGLFSSVMRRNLRPSPLVDGTDSSSLTYGEENVMGRNFNPPDTDLGSLRQVEDGEYLQWNDTCAQVVFAVEVPVRVCNELIRDDDSTDKYLEPIKLVKVRNLYGRHTWAGDWSPSSHLWNRDIRKYLNAHTVHETMTWMRIEDFVKEYDTFCSTQNFPGAPWVYYSLLSPCPEGHLPLHADQFYITVADPLSRRGEEPEYTSDQALSVEIYLSQPDRDAIYQNFRDGADLPELMEARLFRSELRILQDCYNDNEGEFEIIPHDEDDNIYVDEKVPKPPLYLWPGKDAVALQESADSQFVTRRQVRLQPGSYVLIVQQAYHRDEINYCLRISHSDPNGTGFRLSAESIGTLTNPRL